MAVFRCRSPRRTGAKETKLYRVWINMQQRVKGSASAHPEYFRGVPLAWDNFADFRGWAVANGFSKRNCSPDRIVAELGYVPGNIVWKPIHENMLAAALKTNSIRYGPEPPPPHDYDDVPF
jgi:hypothetical protein